MARKKWILVSSNGFAFRRRGEVLKFDTRADALFYRDKNLSDEGMTLFIPVPYPRATPIEPHKP